MKIINPQVQSDLELGRPLKLDLGGGARGREGCYTVDRRALDGIDILADLNEPLDLLPNDCAELIYSRHVLEHVRELLPLMKEIHRITRPQGRIEIIVPHFSNPYAYSDPTHVRFFGLYTMYYFVAAEHQPKLRRVPAFYSDVRFSVEAIKIGLLRRSVIDKLLLPPFARWINSRFYWQDFYERRLCRCLPAEQICYQLRPVKPGSPEATSK
jgi:SAM-dependent methyltransferase